MTRVLIADDEQPARQRLARLLTELRFELVGEASNGLEALKAIENLKPEIALLDIDMPELDGLGVAEALGGNGPAVIFTTAYDEHALRAFEVCAVDYLLKPVNGARLQAALEKAERLRRFAIAPGMEALFRHLENQRGTRRLAVKCGARYVVFSPEQISALISRDHYTALLVEGRELLADDPLDTICARLDPGRFLRVHRGAVINVDFLRELEREGDRKYVAVLADPQKSRVPVSRERLGGLKERLGLGV